MHAIFIPHYGCNLFNTGNNTCTLYGVDDHVPCDIIVVVILFTGSLYTPIGVITAVNNSRREKSPITDHLSYLSNYKRYKKIIYIHELLVIK